MTNNKVPATVVDSYKKRFTRAADEAILFMEVLFVAQQELEKNPAADRARIAEIEASRASVSYVLTNFMRVPFGKQQERARLFPREKIEAEGKGLAATLARTVIMPGMPAPRLWATAEMMARGGRG
jgi:hypothetical protein